MLSISSFSLALTVFLDLDDMFKSPFGYLIASVFWVFLAAGYFVFSKIAASRRKYENNHPDSKKERRSRRPGIITFFANPTAAKADVLLGVSLTLTVTAELIPPIDRKVTIVCCSILIFALHMHCLYNGVNYSYLQEIVSLRPKRRGQN